MTDDECLRCGGPAAEVPKGKGSVSQASIIQERVIERRKFSFKMWRYNPWVADSRDRVRMNYTEFALCNKCAGDVFDFALGKEVAA